MTTQPSIQYKVLNIIKVLLIVLTFGFLFYKLYYAYHLPELYSKQHQTYGAVHFLYLAGVLALTGLNWLVESAKWRLLISKGEPTTFKEAVKGVLSGVALGIITPNELGTFVGRIIHLKELSKVRGSLVSVIGNTAQMMMTMIFGGIAGICFAYDQGYISHELWLVALVIAIGVASVLIFMFFHIHRVSEMFVHRTWSKYLDVFNGYASFELVQVLFISLLRYFIFTIQYLLLVSFYGIQMDASTALMCVSCVLFIQAFVPSFILLDIGIRGVTALWIFGFYTNQPTQVLLMSYSVWISNIMLPGLLGLYFIVKWRGSR